MRFWQVVGLMLSRPQLAARDPLIRFVAGIFIIILLLWGVSCSH